MLIHQYSIKVDILLVLYNAWNLKESKYHYKVQFVMDDWKVITMLRGSNLNSVGTLYPLAREGIYLEEKNIILILYNFLLLKNCFYTAGPNTNHLPICLLSEIVLWAWYKRFSTSPEEDRN